MGVDRYKRTVAICYVGDTDINAWMVENGWALAYHKYSKDYVAQEKSANNKKLGMWRGKFRNPWDFRSDARHSQSFRLIGCYHNFSTTVFI